MIGGFGPTTAEQIRRRTASKSVTIRSPDWVATWAIWLAMGILPVVSIALTGRFPPGTRGDASQWDLAPLVAGMGLIVLSLLMLRSRVEVSSHSVRVVNPFGSVSIAWLDLRSIVVNPHHSFLRLAEFRDVRGVLVRAYAVSWSDAWIPGREWVDRQVHELSVASDRFRAEADDS